MDLEQNIVFDCCDVNCNIFIEYCTHENYMDFHYICKF